MERIDKLSLNFLAGKWPLENNKKNLVFIHGAGTTSLSWILQIKGLSNAANVIAPDLPGHGKTKGRTTNIPDYAKVVSRFIDELGINECVIIGASMGGAIVQEILADHTAKIQAGVLINTGAKLKVLPAIIEAVKNDFTNFIIGMTDILFPANSDIKKIDSSLKEMLEIKQNIVLQDLMTCNGFDLRERLKEINFPVLVISSKDDIMTPLWYGKYLKENIKNADLLVIEGAGHLSYFEKSDVVNSAILKFIDSLE